MAFRVTAKAWEHGWELYIEGVGVTQAEGVDDAEAMVRDYLEIDGLDSAAPINITFGAQCERSTLLTPCVNIGCD
ncbi:hypothetical protein [Glycomyces sp. NRRL B-16210]|uniref:hypothetical protein n=1 Tax=Glycomyces sp. NRRL B-16210 TaxID=1463821 RepID=UPI0004C09CDF|nr:hypothetical protein [Glycomyces sp. NRRL B-16210]